MKFFCFGLYLFIEVHWVVKFPKSVILNPVSKIRNLLAIKICSSKYEDLEALLKMDTETLLSKYEQVMILKESEKTKLLEGLRDKLQVKSEKTPQIKFSS